MEVRHWNTKGKSPNQLAISPDHRVCPYDHSGALKTNEVHHLLTKLSLATVKHMGRVPWRSSLGKSQSSSNKLIGWHHSYQLTWGPNFDLFWMFWLSFHWPEGALFFGGWCAGCTYELRRSQRWRLSVWNGWKRGAIFIKILFKELDGMVFRQRDVVLCSLMSDDGF